MIIVDFQVRNKSFEAVSSTVMNTYFKMIQFMLGQKMMGDQLKHPSGKLASALTYQIKQLPAGGFSIKFRINEQIAPEAKTVLFGRPSITIDPAKGHRYRVIPLRVPNSSTANGELLHNPVLQQLFATSRSGKSHTWDSLVSFMANIYHTNNNPNEDRTSLSLDPKDQQYFTGHRNFLLNQSFEQIMKENPQYQYGHGKFDVKFVTVKRGTRWTLPARAPSSALQGLIDSLKRNLR